MFRPVFCRDGRVYGRATDYGTAMHCTFGIFSSDRSGYRSIVLPVYYGVPFWLLSLELVCGGTIAPELTPLAPPIVPTLLGGYI